MRFGFRKSFSLGGGFRINLTHKGFSVSGGTKGARASAGTRGTNLRVSAPGTGLYAEKRVRMKGAVGSTKRAFGTLVVIYRLIFVIVCTSFFIYWLISQVKRG